MRDRARDCSQIIMRDAEVKDSTHLPKEFHVVHGEKSHIKHTILNTMPLCDAGKIHVMFFKSREYLENGQVEKEYEQHQLVPIHPYFLADVNEKDPKFAMDHLNGTVWRNAHGILCYCSFGQHNGKRRVEIDKFVFDFHKGLFLAGVHKKKW